MKGLLWSIQDAFFDPHPPVHPLADGAGDLGDALAALPVVPRDVHGQRVRVLQLLVAVGADLPLRRVTLHPQISYLFRWAE